MVTELGMDPAPAVGVSTETEHKAKLEPDKYDNPKPWLLALVFVLGALFGVFLSGVLDQAFEPTCVNGTAASGQH